MRRVLSPSLFTLSVALCCTLSCQKRVFEPQEDGNLNATEKEITIDVPSESDILIVIDNSGSMAEEIQRTQRDILSFVQELNNLGNKFRIAVTTTDVPANDPTNPSCNTATSGPPDVDAKNNGRCGKFIRPKTRAETFLDSQSFASSELLAARFKEYINLGSTINTSGSPVEQPIKAAYLALDPKNSGTGGANAGFFRQDALTLIIILTDESDCSFPIDNDGTAFTASSPFGLPCYQMSQNLGAPDDWAQKITNLRGDKRRIAVGVISAAMRDQSGTLRNAACIVNASGGASDACDCFLDNDGQYCAFTRGAKAQSFSACQGAGCCTALANDRLQQFASNFKSDRDTICQTNFSQTLVRLARLADQQCFPLDRIPLNNDPVNIQIKLKRSGDGEKFQVVPLVTEGTGDGWYYVNSAGPQVCLQVTFKRKVGDTLKLLTVDEAGGAFATTPQ